MNCCIWGIYSRYQVVIIRFPVVFICRIIKVTAYVWESDRITNNLCSFWNRTFTSPLYNNASHLNIAISCFGGNNTFQTCQFRALITRLCHSMKIEADNANCWGKALFYKKCRYNLHQPCNYRWRVCNFLNKYYICLSYL